ncbi:hypothetical protein QQA02_05005 [Corynebacterium sp. MSK006]|uniref:hypothetical protein n=1 Tax=Corynebacterium TaxID=1716 RepID=UPI00254AF837|nr:MULTISPECIES: hypothetical protein [Corynebacterium]MDK8895055.1 hypothetical protein [Corynebacterium sp. MSK006]
MSASDTRGDATPLEIDAKMAKWADLCAKLSLVVIALGAVSARSSRWPSTAHSAKTSAH